MPTGNLPSARFGHTATLLPDHRVLLAGGVNQTGFLTSTELYDEATGLFTMTAALPIARHLQTATLLGDGRILLAGGENQTGFLASAELYDPSTGRWIETGTRALRGLITRLRFSPSVKCSSWVAKTNWPL